MRAAKIDANQPAIVQGLRAYGCSVQSLASVGKGCVDILVGYRCINLCFEIKDPAKPPSARKLTPDQVKWHADWKGSVYVIETLEQAIAIIEESFA